METKHDNYNLRNSPIVIMAIVFSALSGTEFGVAGGIIGLIANYKQARQDRINNIVDNQ